MTKKKVRPKGLRKAKPGMPWAYHKVVESHRVWLYNFNVDLFRDGDLAKFNREAIAWIDSVCPNPEAG